MLEAWRATGGRYDPTLLAAIDAAGYATSVDGSGPRSAGPRGPRAGRGLRRRARARSAPLVAVPSGAGIDPGGIGKGLAADIVVTELLERRSRRRAGRHRRRPRRRGHAAGTGRLARGREASARPLAHADDGRARGGRRGHVEHATRTWVDDGERATSRHRPGDGRRRATTDLAAVTVFPAPAGRPRRTPRPLCSRAPAGALDYLDQAELDGIVTTLAGVTTSTPALASAGETEWSAA